MVNPAYRPSADDVSSRYRVIEFDTACAAKRATEEAIERQRVRNHLRTQPVLCYSTEAECLSRTLYHANVGTSFDVFDGWVNFSHLL
eukprot:6570890-Pyramimonas_sp.AAC.1